MTDQISQPTSLNLLSQLGFTFQIHQIPNVNFFVTRCNLPGVTVGEARLGTPFATLHLPPDKAEFDDLRVTFKVNEDLSNWRELFNWLMGLSFPKGSQQRAAWVASSKFGDNLQSDGTLSILSSHKNPIVVARFKNLMPVSLSSIEFAVDDQDVEYVAASVAFKYTYFDMSTAA